MPQPAVYLEHSREQEGAERHACDADEHEHAAPGSVDKEDGHGDEKHLPPIAEISACGWQIGRATRWSTRSHLHHANKYAEKEGLGGGKSRSGQDRLGVEVDGVDACRSVGCVHTQTFVR